jgi:hypothetical protein
VSPIEGAPEGIWRQQVEPSEIEHLIVKGISPFGPRLVAGTFGAEELERLAEELAEQSLADFQALAEAIPSRLSESPTELRAGLVRAARSTLEPFTAAPGEGIEKRDPPSWR